MMWMLSASSRCRWVSVAGDTRGGGVSLRWTARFMRSYAPVGVDLSGLSYHQPTPWQARSRTLPRTSGSNPARTGSAAGKLRRSNWRRPPRRGLLVNVSANALMCRCAQGVALLVLCAVAAAQDPPAAPVPAAPVPAAPAEAPAEAAAPGAPAVPSALPSPAEQLEEVIVQ